MHFQACAVSIELIENRKSRKGLLGSAELCNPSRRGRLISHHLRFVLELQFVALRALLWPEWARLSHPSHFGKLRLFCDLARDRLLSSRSLCLPLPLPLPWLLLLRCFKMPLSDRQAALSIV